MDKTRETKRPRPLRRAVTFLATAVLILTAVFLVANWEKLNFDFIRRYFSYRSLARNEDGQVESFAYDGGANSSFARMGNDLIVCTRSGVKLYSESGAIYVEQTCSLTNPVLTAVGNTALVYDAGGTDLFVYRDRELAFTLPSEYGHSILSASLSAQGLLAVATQTTGAKGEVTIYDSSFQRTFGIKLSSRFITDAILSPDGHTLALATSGETGGAYDSQIAFYALPRTDSESKADATCSLGNNAVLKLNWNSDPLRVLGENALVFVNPDGTQAGSYSYNWRYLKGFSLDGDRFCTLLLGKYRAASAADLVTVDLTGRETASLPTEEQVLSLSSSGRYLSVLTVDLLTIYSEDLNVYHITEDLQGARKVLQRRDGSVTLIAPDTARLYLPD